ncbi:MAG: DNA-directed RNA polymerase subunit beta' [Candidatus Harrisonbacteria bacterium CG10_big_fil_rev_8_21_14_0_10_45_28]|uniref:DNA-directed RNA polymerase subunit beta' n=1 Tax=Candidatus Harrisonbacteria bacterium CG10_big_fil_rev_8_21_14_0_10_45_28 TaxID=1974586 RepID=A0A2H0UNQ9_9BACT|nr:MAG: DNA-directed RNA polymerase subunit beta' [Candidatus Harrisonbacteria bacterium CG10_big_fil_rev_8_21_14_0_10_45_28]
MEFNSIRLKVASPEDILRWSYGEVIKSETINYRTQRPEKDGLFSERIFGPTKDWECYCGKYRRIRYKGVVCDKCGVEVTRSVVRRERMGHVALATPVAHIWYLRNAPSKLSLLLSVSLPKLEKVIYYAAYMVVNVNEDAQKEAIAQIESEFKARKKTVKDEGIDVEDLKEAMSEVKKRVEGLHVGQVLTETEYHDLASRFGNVFEAQMGASALKRILERIDLDKFISELKKEITAGVGGVAKEARQMKRLKIVTSMKKHGMRPEWMIMSNLPIIPPDLRPMVALDGGRYATSDLNDLYRRVINRNNRLKKLIDLRSPEVILINEKRMLQEAVDALIDNAVRGGSQQTNSQRRPLRSLADMLKGKQGRFRQNLLGKRVDYSGRSVIVVGPKLKLKQCGLPKKMALELFRPFVIAKIIERGLAHNVKNSNRLIEATGPEIWAILEEVIQNRRVLLNRAPTLHRMGIQAFEPLLIEDFAIQLHPMVCTAFNADFDGDQMAVHLPLSDEAQEEAKNIMLSGVNLLKPATGDPIVVPTQDMVLGVYFLTKIDETAKGAGRVLSGIKEALFAFENEEIAINAPIVVYRTIVGKASGRLETSLGRMIFNEALPKEWDFVNEALNKKGIVKLVSRIVEEFGSDGGPDYLDAIKDLGFEYVTQSGITWGIDDLIVPEEKPAIVEEASQAVKAVHEKYQEGFLTASERKARTVSIWTDARAKIAALVPKALNPRGSVFSIIDSGSRGSWTQVVQVTGMKGLVQNSQSETIELPIISSFREGFDVLEFFIATHGARKGTTDTALKTAAAGYLTRRLVDVSQDIVIREDNCRTKEGIEIFREDGEEIDHKFSDRLFSRMPAEDIKDGKKILVKANEVINRDIAKTIEEAESITSVKVRSPITCKTLYGVCTACYGYDLGRNKLIAKGEAVGVVAAQSIGEPGTQLTMRTFHIGGVAGADITNGLPRVVELFEVRPPKGRAFLAKEDGVVTDVEAKDLLKIVRVTSEGGKKPKVTEYAVPRSSSLTVKIGDSVKKGERICEGNVDLKELFELKGRSEVEREIVRGVQSVYMSEGASINNKHIEVIVKQMFSRVKIKDSGDSDFIAGEIIEKSKFLEINREIKRAGKMPAKAKQLLLGITKVALSTESFLSAASFQETARVLVNSAVEGKEDVLRGLKENVIIGRAVPIGTNYLGNAGFADIDDVDEDEEISGTESVSDEAIKEAVLKEAEEKKLEEGKKEIDN